MKLSPRNVQRRTLHPRRGLEAQLFAHLVNVPAQVLLVGEAHQVPALRAGAHRPGQVGAVEGLQFRAAEAQLAEEATHSAHGQTGNAKLEGFEGHFSEDRRRHASQHVPEVVYLAIACHGVSFISISHESDFASFICREAMVIHELNIMLSERIRR